MCELTTGQLKSLVHKSKTFAEILRGLGSSNYNSLKNKLNREGIDYSHIPSGKYAGRGRCYHKNQVTVAEVLTTNSKYCRKTAKKVIFREKLLPYKCAICGLGPLWNNKTMTLRLDDINGIRDDHRLENLRFLCPNCDSQTPTWGGRNQKRDKIKHICSQCGSTRSKDSKSGLCIKCTISNRKSKIIPSCGELKKLIWKVPATAIALQYGVSDKAVAKWCKKYDIEKPGPGYWVKQHTGGQFKYGKNTGLTRRRRGLDGTNIARDVLRKAKCKVRVPHRPF